MIPLHPPQTVSLSSLEEGPTRDQPKKAASVPEPQPDADADGGSPGPADPSDGDADTERDGTGEYRLPLDQTFEILKNSRRRQTLQYLQDNDGETTLSDLAEEIAATENDTTVKAISSSQRKRVYVGLYQCHLPKMDDTDVVEYDQNRGTIELGPNAEQLTPYLDESEATPWHKLYTAVALTGLVLFVVSQAGGAAIGLTSTVVLVLLLGGMGVSVTAHYLSTTDRLSF